MIKSGLIILICLLVFIMGQTALNSVSERLTVAQNLVDQKKLEEALAEIKNLLKEELKFTTQDSISLYNLFGQCFSSLKQYEKAVK